MLLIYRHQDHQRIDKYLSRLEIPQLFSRTYIDELIEKGMIKIEGKKIKKSHKLSKGETIEIQFPPPKKNEITPENIPIEILWEDEFLAFVNKPAGMTVHPAPGNETGTLVNALLYKFEGKLAKGINDSRPGIVHRLDKDTSGVMIIAKDRKVSSFLTKMFQKREITKTYRAIIAGEPKESEATIRTRIARSKTDRKKMAVLENGKRAVTHYKIIEFFDLFSYLEIYLETGRTHQIRVHFSHLNCPILGDMVYSSLKRTLSMLPVHYHKKMKYLLANHLQRQALHSHKIELIHPITQKKMEITAPIPEDMQYTLNWLKKNFFDE